MNTKKILMAAGLFGALLLMAWNIGLTINAVNSQSDLLSANESINSLREELKKTKLEISTVQSGNGTSLDKCLDTAAKEYGNFIKSKGKVNADEANITYVDDFASWEAVNKKLESDRTKCQEQFK